MQFKQTHFQRQRFLHVRVKQPLRLFEDLQILHRLPGRDAPGHLARAGEFGKISAIHPRRQRLQPDISQPPLQNHQHIRPLPTILRLDRRRQLVLPPVAQLFSTSSYLWSGDCAVSASSTCAFIAPSF